jgi:predicted O-linked N-acetylglucosamine transferase (SPINDLY family)
MHSLWMGLPVVTLAGQRALSRAGLTILSHVGLPELIAQTPEQYVQTAAGLAGDLPRLEALRRSLREKMRCSPLLDAAAFARGVEEAYLAMWRG